MKIDLDMQSSELKGTIMSIREMKTTAGILTLALLCPLAAFTAGTDVDPADQVIHQFQHDQFPAWKAKIQEAAGYPVEVEFNPQDHLIGMRYGIQVEESIRAKDTYVSRYGASLPAIVEGQLLFNDFTPVVESMKTYSADDTGRALLRKHVKKILIGIPSPSDPAMNVAGDRIWNGMLILRSSLLNTFPRSPQILSAMNDVTLLSERRAIDAFREKRYPDWKAKIEAAAGYPVPIDVRWRSFAFHDFLKENKGGYDEALPKVYFTPLVEGIKAFTASPSGRDRFKQRVKKIVVSSNHDADREPSDPPYGISIGNELGPDGTLTFGANPGATGWTKQKTMELMTYLEKTI